MSRHEAAAAMAQAEQNARRRMDAYARHPGRGISAGTVGGDPQQLALPEDPAITCASPGSRLRARALPVMAC